MKVMYRVNTSNKLKLEEFRRFLVGADIEIYQKDLQEPQADAVTVVRYKASQFDSVLVDDSSLDIEDGDNHDFGVNIKWNLDKLDCCIGRPAVFTCLLGIREENKVLLFKGQVIGDIVRPRGKPYGFLHYFQPNGADQTLAEHLPDQYNPRYFAVQDFLARKPYLVTEPLFEWQGEFQE